MVTQDARNRDQLIGSAARRLGSAGARFAEAVAAFGVGDHGRAETLFGAFAEDFSTDSRAEDATFLRADARARRGDKAGAAALQRAPAHTFEAIRTAFAVRQQSA